MERVINYIYEGIFITLDKGFPQKLFLLGPVSLTHRQLLISDINITMDWKKNKPIKK